MCLPCLCVVTAVITVAHVQSIRIEAGRILDVGELEQSLLEGHEPMTIITSRLFRQSLSHLHLLHHTLRHIDNLWYGPNCRKSPRDSSNALP